MSDLEEKERSRKKEEKKRYRAPFRLSNIALIVSFFGAAFS